MKEKTVSRLTLAGAALTLLLAVNVYLTFQNTHQLNMDDEWVERTHLVVNSLYNILSLAKDAETGTRGFYITGDPEYLEPYNSAVAGIDAALADLEVKTAGDPVQQAHMPELRERIKARFAILETAIVARKDPAFNPAGPRPSITRGKIEMDGLRDLLAEMTATERSRLTVRLHQSEQTYRYAQASGLFSGFLALAALLAGLLLLRKHLAERAAAAAVISEHAERLRTTLSSIGDAVITTDLDARITNMNPVAEMLTGWKNGDALNVPLDKVFNIVNETSRETVENPAAKALRDGVVVGLANHTVLIAKDGTENAIDDSAAPIRSREGDIVGCVLVFRDVTERRRQSRDLEESSVRLKQLADAMPQIVWAALPDGTLDYYNRRWFEYIDKSQDAMEESTWDRHIHPDDIQRAYKKWAEAIAHGERYDIEFRVRRGDGRYRWFLTRALPVIDKSGQIIRWYGTCTDINEEKQRADDLRQLAANLSEADRRKNEFLAMLAHELRNPLAPIRNALQIMRMTGEVGTTIRSASDMMDRQVAQLVRLVDDLLDVSRISRGKIELRLERVDLASIINQAVEAARPASKNRGVSLNVSLPPEPVFLNGDAARLNQVVGNLVNNSCKFTDKGGQVEITVTSEGEEAVIEVRDTGIGIAENEIRSIFDMFVQADTSLERTVSGLGIGLTLVRTLVEMHGGTVVAASDGLGKGSVFTVRLPALMDDSLPVPAEVPAAGRMAAIPRRILVVDDNLDSVQSLSMLLKITGHDVRTANDGVEAVDVASAFRPEVVLLDIGLPRMNGYEAAREIRSREWGKDMVLIALTGWGQDEDRKRSKEAGFDIHLVKPVDHVDLVKRLDEIGSAEV